MTTQKSRKSDLNRSAVNTAHRLRDILTRPARKPRIWAEARYPFAWPQKGLFDRRTYVWWKARLARAAGHRSHCPADLRPEKAGRTGQRLGRRHSQLQVVDERA